MSYWYPNSKRKPGNNGFNVGDLITTADFPRHEIFKIVRIVPKIYGTRDYLHADSGLSIGDPGPSIIYYQKISDKDGNTLNGKAEYSSDADQCKDALQSVNEQMEEFQKRILRLKEVIRNNSP